MSYAKISSNCLILGQIGWKYYNSIRKKAVEQEFSLSGLILTLSIAFFITAGCSQGLNLIYQSMELTDRHNKMLNQRIYLLESRDLINTENLDNFSNQNPPETVSQCFIA